MCFSQVEGKELLAVWLGYESRIY